MNTKKLLVVASIAIVLAAAGVFIGINRKAAQAPQPTNTDSSTGVADTKPPVTENNDNTPAAATITYSDKGFTPAEITVKAGSIVEVRNTSGHALQFDSNPHPAHTDDPELNAGFIASGASKRFTLTTTGTWGYHNHLNSSESGKVHVE